MDPKPAHLSSAYASQFQDVAVARAYSTRPAYPDSLFEILIRLAGGLDSPILDLGCGTGDVAIGLAERGCSMVDAVEPSNAMLELGRDRSQATDASIQWIQASAEDFDPKSTYSLVVAAESLHWMDWNLVLPKIGRYLSNGGCLAIVSGRRLRDVPWEAALQPLLSRFSTNRDYRAYDLIEELTVRKLFRTAGSDQTSSIVVRQPIDEYVESFHSRNGFSRERMAPDHARDFDQAIRELVLEHSSDDVVVGEVAVSVTWGVPIAK